MTGEYDYDERTFYYDEKQSKSVEVTKPTTPSPLPEQIPWWVIAAGAAGIGLIVTVAIVAYEERRREEMLLLTLLR